MQSEAEIEAAFSCVFEALLKAGWIDRVVFTEGGGFEPTWTMSGLERLVILRDICDGYGLSDGEDLLELFQIGLDGDRPLVSGGHVSAADADFWANHVRPLGLKNCSEVMTLVHIALAWGGLSGDLKIVP